MELLIVSNSDHTTTGHMPLCLTRYASSCGRTTLDTILSQVVLYE
jgi:hypothetical protein